MIGNRVWKVSYHGGELFALVEAATPDEATEIAKAHREAKYRGTPPISLDNDSYEVSVPTERDIEWARSFGMRVLNAMPKTAGKVRRRRVEVSRASQTTEEVKTPSGALDGAVGGLPIALNGRWRVVDDPIQWILQKRTGQPTAKTTGWRSAPLVTCRDAAPSAPITSARPSIIQISSTPNVESAAATNGMPGSSEGNVSGGTLRARAGGITK